MLKVLAGFGVRLLLTTTLAGCGGQASGAPDEAVGGNQPSHVDQGGTGGSSLGATPGGTNASVDGPTPGGSAGSDVSNIGGVGGGLPGGLVQCPAAELFASVSVSGSGMAKDATDGKARVTVTKLEQEPAYQLAASPELQTHRYLLHGANRDWQVQVTIPGLESELIKEGDALDFQLETSPGYIPLAQVVNQAFGLFTPEGELLLFGASMIGHDLIPDLSFVGLEASDGGVACGLGGPGCQYRVSTAHIRSPSGELDLQPGHTGQLGNLEVGVQSFQEVLSNAGTCDDSGRSLMFGFKTTPKAAK